MIRPCKLYAYTYVTEPHLPQQKCMKKCRSSDGEYKMPPDSLLSEKKV